MTYREIQNEIKRITYRKSLEKEARNIKLNGTTARLREILTDLQQNPPLNNTAFRVRQQEQERIVQRNNRINQLRNQLPVNPRQAFNELSDLGYNFTSDDIDNLLRNVAGRFTITIRFVGGTRKEFTLTRENVERLRSMLINKAMIQGLEVVESDTLADYAQFPIESFHMEEIRGNNVRRNNGFFEYLNNTDIPLEKYQIYTKDSRDESEDECCVLFALKQQGVSDDKLQLVVSMMGAMKTNIPLSKMEEICNLIEKKIILNYFDESEKKRGNRTHKYGAKFNDVIELAQFKNHIFAYQYEPYTAHYIDYKDEIDTIYNNKQSIIKKEMLTAHIVSGKVALKSRDPRQLSSLDLVVKLFNNGHFTEYNTDLTRKFSDNYELKPSLLNLVNEQRLIRHVGVNSHDEDEDEKEEKVPKKTIYLFGDTESDVSGKVHEMIAFGFCDINGNYKKVLYDNNYSEEDELNRENFANRIKQAMKQMVDSLNYNKGDKVVMFFHNLKYDATLFHDLIYCNSECVKDNQVYSKVFNFDSIRVEFRDSYKHFGGKLANASKTFELGLCKGEAINYKFHTKKNIMSNEPVNIKKYMKDLTDEDKEIFLKEAKIENSRFNATWYYLAYLQKDVEVLRLAMIKYRKLIHDITGLDAFEYLTISSIGNAYAKSQGCYDGLVETKGCLRQFIQESVKGGRVYVNPTYENEEISEDIEDFDGVSLYPSSMQRLCEEYGLPIGEIKKGLENNYYYYESKSWYIVKIKLNKINKSQQVPCISIRSSGSLKYVNIIDSPVELYVDRITLNDYITFHDIEYEIVEGVYWDQGFNKKLGEMIVGLHNERCKYKKTNKPKADMIKLLMNSIYGKTGMRISETKTIFVANDKADKYTYDHFGTISEIQRTPFNTRFIKRVCDDSYNLNYVASAILSMSKRIMNEVFSVMNDNKQPVYYTDTDSIHMLKKDVEELGLKYKKKYNKSLIGKNLGQFHTDFDMKGCTDVYSIKHIPIATKTYLDVLVGTNDKGEIEQDVHIRIKGITEAGIKYELDERMREGNIDKVQASINLFRDLANDKKVKFYLNPTDHNVSFDFKNGQVSTRVTQSFQRVLNDDKE